ncbi:hypothetical protein P885DRAFT_63726 [Corynascus similis CBS 632.67]
MWFTESSTDSAGRIAVRLAEARCFLRHQRLACKSNKPNRSNIEYSVNNTGANQYKNGRKSEPVQAINLLYHGLPRRAKRPAPRPRPGESAAHQRARANHNLVEQKYRHRLHARFEALLDALPEGILSEDSIDQARDNGGAGWDDGSGTSGGRGVKGKNNRRMSKVDVLSKAERRSLGMMLDQKPLEIISEVMFVCNANLPGPNPPHYISCPVVSDAAHTEAAIRVL